ncbi:dihydroorotate dehydrogenase (quinone) [Leptospira perolatii]|uniref:Dihydroorotate dehydrogenase (quinone) n=1 Tax=Leptospira perolatii TaxID=2023191 RepID=A0A2M9ZKV6_9LEPT|nr:quinone-dependent dihydroorotate dehydrogenase [Leptospira perolatii]PJZ69981.1 dihydroorotate dehydrogenase (quinone) [Leptospira perolatii]PJZ72611.1 dihydroorotate dehydrogenase (quinone) [Leptospira perolatii]
MLSPVNQWFYEKTLKPLLFNLDPESAHTLAVKLLEVTKRFPFAFPILEKLTNLQSERLKTQVAGIEFSNPLGLGAGFDKTGELFPFLSRLGFGSIEIGTITGQSQPGNPKPRIFRYPADQALINRMGFNNPGAERVSGTLKYQKKSVIRGINVGKTKVVSEEDAVLDYVYSLERLAQYADYAVINISSPNTPGLRNFQKTENFQKLISGIRKGLGGSFPVPTFVKFAPDMTDQELEDLIDCTLDLQVAGIVLTNTTVDKTVLKQYPNVESEGGVSGRPLRKRSTEMIQVAYRKLKGRLPIIGVGGIDSGESALEKILAGADLIQIYTGYIYQGPFLPVRILEYIDSVLHNTGAKSIANLVGVGKL